MAAREIGWVLFFLFAARAGAETAADRPEKPYDLNGDGRVVGLALSGGGLRATGVACGALLELEEQGLLEHVDLISAVSGGAIVAAHYSLNFSLEKFGPKLETNLATGSLGKVLSPKNLFDGKDTNRTEGFAETLDELFYGGRRMGALRDRPQLLINATNLDTGNLFVFSKAGSSDESWKGSEGLPLYQLPENSQALLKVSSAVAASSAIPTVFVPYEMSVVRRDVSPASPAQPKTIRLIDGGVVDNQGLETLLLRKCDVILSVDASVSVITEKGYKFFTPGSTKVIPILRKRFRDLLLSRAGELLGERFIHLGVTDEQVSEMSILQTHLEKEEVERLVAHGRELIRGNADKIRRVLSGVSH